MIDPTSSTSDCASKAPPSASSHLTKQHAVVSRNLVTYERHRAGGFQPGFSHDPIHCSQQDGLISDQLAQTPSGNRDEQGLFLRPVSSGKGLSESFSYEIRKKPMFHFPCISDRPVNPTQRNSIDNNVTLRGTTTNLASSTPRGGSEYATDLTTSSKSNDDKFGGFGTSRKSGHKEDFCLSNRLVQTSDNDCSVRIGSISDDESQRICPTPVSEDKIKEDQSIDNAKSRDIVHRTSVEPEGIVNRSNDGSGATGGFSGQQIVETASKASENIATAEKHLEQSLNKTDPMGMNNDSLVQIVIDNMWTKPQNYETPNEANSKFSDGSMKVQKTQKKPKCAPKNGTSLPQAAGSSVSVSDIIKILQHKITREQEQATRTTAEDRSRLIVELQKMQQQCRLKDKKCEVLEQRNAALSLEVVRKNHLLKKLKSRVEKFQGEIMNLDKDVTDLRYEKGLMQKETTEMHNDYDLLKTDTSELLTRVSNVEQRNEDFRRQIRAIGDEASRRVEDLVQKKEKFDDENHKRIAVLAADAERCIKHDEALKELISAKMKTNCELKRNQEKVLAQLVVLETFIKSLESANAAKLKHDEQVTRFRSLEIKNETNTESLLKVENTISNMSTKISDNLCEKELSDGIVHAVSQGLMSILKGELENLRADLMEYQAAEINERHPQVQSMLERETSAKDEAIAQLNKERIQWKSIQESFDVAIAEAAKIRLTLEDKINQKNTMVAPTSSLDVECNANYRASHEGHRNGVSFSNNGENETVPFQTISEAIICPPAMMSGLGQHRNNELLIREAIKQNRYDGREGTDDILDLQREDTPLNGSLTHVAGKKRKRK